MEIMRRWWRGFNEDGTTSLALCDEAIDPHPPDFPVPGPVGSRGRAPLVDRGVRRFR